MGVAIKKGADIAEVLHIFLLRQVMAVRVLWLNKFDFSGNTEAVMAWARGVVHKGLKLHLVLTGIPPSLLELYKKFINKSGLQSSLNINWQQVQNLLYYHRFDLLHVFHPDLFRMAADLSNSFQIPWVASVFDGEHHDDFTFLYTAAYITCCNSSSFLAIKDFFYPYVKQNILIIPQGVTIKPSSFPPLTKMNILYVGPLGKKQVAPFQALKHAVKDLKSSSLGVVSRYNVSPGNVTFYSWRPDFNVIIGRYNVIAGFGYYLLQGIAAGKIALILEEKYAGIFLPLQREQVPDFRAKAQAGKDADPSAYKLIIQDIQALGKQLPAAQKLQQENWSYARENHDLEIIAEKIVRLYDRL